MRKQAQKGLDLFPGKTLTLFMAGSVTVSPHLRNAKNVNVSRFTGSLRACEGARVRRQPQEIFLPLQMVSLILTQLRFI